MFKKFKPKEIYIPLLKTFRCAIISPKDYKKVSKYKWSIVKNGNQEYVRSTTNINGKRQFLHRYILDIIGTDKMVDHKDMNGLNNKRDNIRLANKSTNSMNRPPFKNKSSKYKGVYFDKKKSNKNKQWWAYIVANKKRYGLKYHKTEKDAARAYNEAALKYHGDFAYLNKID